MSHNRVKQTNLCRSGPTNDARDLKEQMLVVISFTQLHRINTAAQFMKMRQVFNQQRRQQQQQKQATSASQMSVERKLARFPILDKHWTAHNSQRWSATFSCTLPATHPQTGTLCVCQCVRTRPEEEIFVLALSTSLFLWHVRCPRYFYFSQARNKQ